VAVLWITFAIIIIDQLTKMMVKGSPWSWLPFKGVPYNSSRPMIDDILRLTYIENPGIAFGINIPEMKVFFAVFSIVASIVILWYMKRNKHRLNTGERVALAMILGGAIGNLIDRVFYGVIYGERGLFYGYVVDFIDFGYKKNWWPVFNIADMAVSCGVILLIILLFKRKPIEQGPAMGSFGDPADRETISFSKTPPTTAYPSYIDSDEPSLVHRTVAGESRVEDSASFTGDGSSAEAVRTNNPIVPPTEPSSHPSVESSRNSGE